MHGLDLPGPPKSAVLIAGTTQVDNREYKHSKLPKTGMPLSVTSRSEDGFAILELAGSLTLSPSLTALRDTARQILDSGNRTGIILVLAGVTITDSAGLGELTVVYTFASRRRCPIMLVKVPPSLRKMLDMTRLEGLLPSADDVASAKKKLS